MNAAPTNERRARRFQSFDKGAPDSTSAMLQGLGLRAGGPGFPRSGRNRSISALAGRAPDFRPNVDGRCGVLRREYRQERGRDRAAARSVGGGERRGSGG